MSTDDIEEYKVLSSVLDAHKNYGNWANEQLIISKQRKYESLNNEEKSLIEWFPNYLNQLKHSIDINSSYFTNIADVMGSIWGAPEFETWHKASSLDFDKIRSIMIQYVREWSSDGHTEREVSFGRILDFAEKAFPVVTERPNVEVLVPGSGLGRLVVEFVKRGFSTQGNELSYHMLLNSNFILNNTYCANNFVLCPFIHKNSNVEKRNYQCRQVYFPDFNPGDISLINEQYPDIPVADLMSMIAGGFVDLYGPPDRGEISDTYTNDPLAVEFRKQNANKFHIIATCYFLDTAANIIDYLKTIKYSLREDGYWINFGPLLWHFEDDDNEYTTKTPDQSRPQRVPFKGLELSKDDLIELIEKMGFEFVIHESNLNSTYGGDIKSLGSWNYKCEYWVCRKKIL